VVVVDREMPVIIGGMGQCGTRTIAEVLEESGFYMGDNRQETRDSIWFEPLFCKIKNTYSLKGADSCLLDKYFYVFEEVMFSPFNSKFATLISWVKIHKLVFSKRFRENNFLMPWKRWSREYPNKILRERLYPSDYCGWGFKDPITQFYLEHFNIRYKKMKYIHIIRHGLDVAFCYKKNQVRRWGQLFVDDITNGNSIEDIDKLRYWVNSNEEVISIGKKLLGDRFYLIKYEDLCKDPFNELDQLCSFLGVSKTGDEIRKMCERIVPSKNIGVYREKDISIFPGELLDSVRDLGFEI
jgi:sulfotransferase family protein